MSRILLGKYHAFPSNFQSHEDKGVLTFPTKEVPSFCKKELLKKN